MSWARRESVIEAQVHHRIQLLNSAIAVAGRTSMRSASE